MIKSKKTRSRREANDLPIKINFGVVDLGFHRRLSKLFGTVFDAEGFGNVHAIAIHLTNNKYYICEQLETMEEWLENLKTADETMDAYYLNAHLNTTMFEDYLNFNGETPLKLTLTDIYKNFSDWKAFFTLIMIIVLNKFMFKLPMRKNLMYGVIMLAVINISLTLFNRWEDFF